MTEAEKRAFKKKPYAEMWNKVKYYTLKECGLTVSLAATSRVVFGPNAADRTAPEREGRWRQPVHCLDPNALEHAEYGETLEEREAKRRRYVQSAMQEQSMGRPGPQEHEVPLPVDDGALQCRDGDTNAEWDALNPFVKLISDKMLATHVADAIIPQTEQYLLRPAEPGALTHSEAVSLTAAAAAAKS
eukprot:s6696_g1.t1